MRVAIQMDPIHTIRVATDSSYLIGLEGQKRGHTLYYYTPDRLSYDDGQIFAMGHKLTFYDNREHFYDLGPLEKLDLSSMDIIFLRQDPPFDMAYITSTYLLERLPASTRVLNNPTSVRDCAEKIFPLDFRRFMVPTMISADPLAIQAFFDIHKDIVIKPLYGHAGSGVVRVREASNIGGIFDIHRLGSKTPLIAQRFIPEVAEGDKRIILIDGEAIGGFKRVPQEGNFRSNTALGGKAVPSELTDREIQLCAELGKVLKEKGLLFVGIDVIGGYLTEINVTSPTGLCYLNPHIPRAGQEILWDRLTNTTQNSSRIGVGDKR